MRCFFCQKIVSEQGGVYFKDACPFCSGDLHICRNCRHYDPHASHACRESSAEYVADKEKANFCEYFQALETIAAANQQQDDVRKKLDALFKK